MSAEEIKERYYGSQDGMNAAFEELVQRCYELEAELEEKRERAAARSAALRDSARKHKEKVISLKEKYVALMEMYNELAEQHESDRKDKSDSSSSSSSSDDDDDTCSLM